MRKEDKRFIDFQGNIDYMTVYSKGARGTVGWMDLIFVTPFFFKNNQQFGKKIKSLIQQ